jgi:hypothetical protein
MVHIVLGYVVAAQAAATFSEPPLNCFTSLIEFWFIFSHTERCVSRAAALALYFSSALIVGYFLLFKKQAIVSEESKVRLSHLAQYHIKSSQCAIEKAF